MVDVAWLDYFFMVGMTSVCVDWGRSVFMGIIFLDFVGWSCGVDTVEVVEAMRCRDCVVV